MQFKVVIRKKTQRNLEKIDAKYRLKVLAAFVELSNNPYVGKKLKGEYEGQWSYSIWPFRIIYQIKNKELIVLIIRIGHRQNVYK